AARAEALCGRETSDVVFDRLSRSEHLRTIGPPAQCDELECERVRKLRGERGAGIRRIYGDEVRGALRSDADLAQDGTGVRQRQASGRPLRDDRERGKLDVRGDLT